MFRLGSFLNKKNLYIILFLFTILIFSKFFKLSFVKESFNYIVPSKFRAFFKSKDGLILNGNHEVPTLLDGEILIKVRSYLIGDNDYCKDFSGVVISKDKNIEDFHYKDRVFGRIPKDTMDKLHKENIICPEIIAIKPFDNAGNRLLSHKPMSLTHVQASNIPYISNNFINFINYNFNHNNEILVTNGISTIGAVLIYYLKNYANIFAIDKDKNDLSKFSILSQENFSSETEFKENISKNKFDFIFNIQGSSLMQRDLYSSLKPDGIIFDFGNFPDIYRKKIIHINDNNTCKAVDFDKIAKMVNNADIPVMIGKVFEMEELSQALAFKEKNKYNTSVNINISKE